MRWGWIASNPATLASPPKFGHYEARPPSPEDVAKLLDAAWARDVDFGTLLWLVMTTGMRRGELCALRWLHVDLDASELLIERSYIQRGKQHKEKDTKTHQARRICLASDFVSDIRVVITPHPVGSSGLEQEGGDDPAGLRARPSWAPRQAVPEPEPEVRAVAAAGDRRAEPGRGGRALRDRPVDGRAHPSGRQQGALEALAASKPG